MTILSEAYALGNRAADDPSSARKPVRLTRRLAEELVLSAVLAPIAASDLTAKQSQGVYATDASLARGAICSCTVPAHVARALWQNGDRRGAYSRLEQGPSVLLKAAGEAPLGEDLLDPPTTKGTEKPPPFVLDVLEIGCCFELLGGPGPRDGLDLGVHCSRTSSRHYDLLNPSFFLWVSDALEARCIRSLLIRPACSCCAGEKDEALWRRSLALLKLAAACKTPALLIGLDEAPAALSKLLRDWVRDLALESRCLDRGLLGDPTPGQIWCLSFAVPHWVA